MDEEEGSLTVTVSDIKHYIYCPRIIYFDKVLHAEEKILSQQHASGGAHNEIRKKDLRRVGAIYYSKELKDAKKIFGLDLSSARLGLKGSLDCLIISDKEYIPADYKIMRSNKGKVWLDHKYQLAAYALLVEEKYNTVVKRGFVYYVPEKRVVEVRITESMKSYVVKVINDIRTIVREEYLPPVRVPLKKSLGCGFYWVCKRV